MRALREMRGLCRDEGGLSTVEYVVLLVLIVGVSVATWNKFGNFVSGKLGEANTEYQENVKIEK